MKLSELLNSVKAVQVVGKAEEKEIEKITLDSREVEKNTLFFAIEGFKTDGHNFILDAINSGAAAVVVQNPDSVPDQIFAHAGCVKIVVEDSRKSLAEFSNIFYGEPSKKLKLIGVTGTKGKSTTAFYIKHLLQSCGHKTGLIGTIANYIGDKEVKTTLTTPQSDTINMLLSLMVKDGCTHCVMEVSSHALHLHRADFLDFDSAVFTNITSDHMDYHKTFDHYLASKKILFDMIPGEGKVIINSDDPSATTISKDAKGKKYFYGTGGDADFRISNIEYNLDRTTFGISFGGKEYSLSTSLIGHFNAFNATAAFAVAAVSGFDPNALVKGVKTTPQVPGRFEVISQGEKKIIIDYAHTADSLKQALTAVRHIVKNDRPVYTVFGCGGDRDKTKRPVMGNIAAEMSTTAIVTSDNPRTEDPSAIIRDVIAGIKSGNFRVIENREQAIKTAIMESEDNAVILIAGKGHENYQEVNGVRSHFSDKETAEKYLAR